MLKSNLSSQTGIRDSKRSGRGVRFFSRDTNEARKTRRDGIFGRRELLFMWKMLFMHQESLSEEYDFLTPNSFILKQHFYCFVPVIRQKLYNRSSSSFEGLAFISAYFLLEIIVY